MEVYQFIAPGIALYYIYRIIQSLKTKKNFLFTSVLWLTFWVIIGVLAIIPHELSTKLANLLGIKSNINAIIFVALAFTILLCFYLSAKIENMDRKITELVRQLALDESKIRELERKRLREMQEREEAKLINKI